MAKHKGVTAGPLRSLRWGGLELSPTMDGEVEMLTSDRTYTGKKSGNGHTYAESEVAIPYIQQDCVMTPAEYEAYIALQDGQNRAGSATTANGDNVSLNCIIDGEQPYTNGVVTVKLSGEVNIQ